MTWAHLRILWFFMRPHRLRYSAILLVSLLTTVLEGVSLAAFFPLFQALMGSSSVAAGGFFARISAVVQRLPIREPLFAAAVVLVVLILLKVALSFVRELLLAHTSGAALEALKNRLMRQYAAAPYEVFVDTQQGTLLYHCLKAPDTVAFLLLRTPQLLIELLKMAVITAVLLAAWPAATAVLLVVGIAYGWLTQQTARRVSYNTGRGRVAAAIEQTHIATDFFRGIRQIAAFCTAPAWLGRFERAGRRYRDLYIKDQVWLAAPATVMELAAVIMLVGALALVRSGGPEQAAAMLPVLGVFGVASLRLLQSLTGFGRLRMELAGRLPDAELAHRVITAPPPARRDGTRAFPSLREGIRFSEVWFTHQGRATLLAGVSLAIGRGETVAIVGPSGSGKTTLINLLLGLYEPSQGAIVVDGMPLGDYRIDTWRARLGLVSQDPFLFHGTVRENILFGRAGFDDAALTRAARIANAHEFVQELPQDYETVIGERGMKLSGGQQQRLAIARAVLGNPDVLLFDEATSHLDAAAERQVQEAIERAAEGRTVILVAHRLTTVRRADRIIVLQGGRIVEEGTHEDLMQRQQHYAQLVRAGT